MKFGYIKINGTISQIFINKSDEQIQTTLEVLRRDLKDTSAVCEWDNKWTDKSMDDLIHFLFKF